MVKDENGKWHFQPVQGCRSDLHIWFAINIFGSNQFPFVHQRLLTVVL